MAPPSICVSIPTSPRQKSSNHAKATTSAASPKVYTHPNAHTRRTNQQDNPINDPASGVSTPWRAQRTRGRGGRNPRWESTTYLASQGKKTLHQARNNLCRKSPFFTEHFDIEKHRKEWKEDVMKERLAKAEQIEKEMIAGGTVEDWGWKEPGTLAALAVSMKKSMDKAKSKEVEEEGWEDLDTSIVDSVFSFEGERDVFAGPILRGNGAEVLSLLLELEASSAGDVTDGGVKLSNDGTNTIDTKRSSLPTTLSGGSANLIHKDTVGSGSKNLSSAEQWARFRACPAESTVNTPAPEQKFNPRALAFTSKLRISDDNDKAEASTSTAAPLNGSIEKSTPDIDEQSTLNTDGPSTKQHTQLQKAQDPSPINAKKAPTSHNNPTPQPPKPLLHRAPFNGKPPTTTYQPHHIPTRTPLSTVLSLPTLFNPSLSPLTRPLAPWPSPAEQKYEGDDRIATDKIHRRMLPYPRSRGNETVTWQYRNFVVQMGLEDFDTGVLDEGEVWWRGHWVEEGWVGDEKGCELIGRGLMMELGR